MTNSNTATVLQAFYAAVNAKDLTQACRFLADDVCFATLDGDLIGKAAVSGHLQALAAADVTFAINVISSVADTVYYAYRIFAQGRLIDAGTDGLARLGNGLINFDGINKHNFQQEQQL